MEDAEIEREREMKEGEREREMKEAERERMCSLSHLSIMLYKKGSTHRGSLSSFSSYSFCEVCFLCVPQRPLNGVPQSPTEEEGARGGAQDAARHDDVLQQVLGPQGHVPGLSHVWPAAYRGEPAKRGIENGELKKNNSFKRKNCIEPKEKCWQCSCSKE